MNFIWPNRQPVGMWWMARKSTPLNLDGLFDAPDINDKGTFIRWAIAETKRVIKNCKKINAQGVYIHGFTNRFIPKNYPNLKRIEYQNPEQFPDALKYIVNFDTNTTLIQHLMTMLLDAELTPGCLIRPSYPRGVFTKNPPRYWGQVPIDRKQVFNYLKPRIDWAYKLGMRFFYIDSPGDQEYMETYIQQFLDAYPDCLFFPEITPVNHLYKPSEEFKYQYGLPWTVWNLNTRYFNRGYATYFSCGQIPNQTKEQLKKRIRSAYIRRSIVGPMVWFNSLGLKLTKQVVEEEGPN